MRITTGVEAYKFASAIVTYQTKNPVWGNIAADILGNGTVFAWINNTAREWNDGEVGLKMQVFTKAHLSFGYLSLTSSDLENIDLDVRFVTIEEVNMLKELLENDQIKLGGQNKEEALELLTNFYLPDTTLHRSSVWIPIKNGLVIDWELVYPYDESIKSVKITGEIDQFGE